MSDFINENKLSPAEAMERGLDAGAAGINIQHNNGVLEVTHSEGGVLLQATDVPDGTWDAIWAILESAGRTVYRARK